MTAESWEANSKEACFHNKIIIRIAVEALSLFVHIYSIHFLLFFSGQICKKCIQENVVHFQYNPVNVCFEVYRELLPNSLMLLIVIHKWISKWLMSLSVIHVGILAPNFFYIILLHQKHFLLYYNCSLWYRDLTVNLEIGLEPWLSHTFKWIVNKLATCHLKYSSFLFYM